MKNRLAAITRDLLGRSGNRDAGPGPGRDASDKPAPAADPVREAFLRPSPSLVPATLTRRRLAPSDESPPVPSSEPDRGPGAVAPSRDTDLPDDTASRATPAPRVPAMAPAAPAADPVSAPAPPARPTAAPPEAEDPDVPRSVAISADEFFDGLVRQTERRP